MTTEKSVTAKRVRDVLEAAGFREASDSNVGFSIHEGTCTIIVEHNPETNAHQWVYHYTKALREGGIKLEHVGGYLVCVHVKE